MDHPPVSVPGSRNRLTRPARTAPPTPTPVSTRRGRKGSGNAFSGLITLRRAVLARFGGAEVDAVRVPQDGLISTEVAVVGDLHLVSARFESLHDVRRMTLLEDNLAAIGHALARGLARAVMAHSRHVARLLQVHAEIDEVDDDLYMTLRLHRAAHHAERQPRLSILRDERGNDGVERPLA